MMLVTASLLLANTYKDPQRGLIWQDDVAAKNVKGYWDDAIEYCENLRLDGHKDWRLPTVQELYTLIDLNADDPAAIEQLKNVESADYWSASVCVSDLADAWLVYFEDGVVNHYAKSRKRNIRCVRSEPKAP
jgi:hypothetical protein